MWYSLFVGWCRCSWRPLRSNKRQAVARMQLKMAVRTRCCDMACAMWNDTARQSDEHEEESDVGRFCDYIRVLDPLDAPGRIKSPR